MSLRLVAIRASEPGVCVVEFDRGGGEPVICTFRVQEHDGITGASPDPDPFADFDGSAEELRQIIRVIVAVSDLSEGVREPCADWPAEASTSSVIDAYMSGLHELSTLLTEELRVTTLGEALITMLRRVRSDGWSTRGTLGGGVAYYVHGAGCRFTLADGRVFELDLDADGSSMSAVWDAWRVREFAESTGQIVNVQRLGELLRNHVERGDLVETRPGWFRGAAT